MLTDLIPDEVVPHGLKLSRKALELRDELASRIDTTDVPPLEVAAFIHRLLTVLCQDGTPLGLALQAPATHPSRNPGQIRQISADAWQPRRSLGEPILCALARQIVSTTATAQPQHASLLPAAINIIDKIGHALDDLSKQGRWATILLTRPRGNANRIFDLHFRIAGYPGWECLALRLQAGLVAQIRKEASKSPSLRDHNILSYCTAPKALVPLMRAELLRSALAELDEDESLLVDVLWQTAARIENVTSNTRRDYVVKFLDMLQRGAAVRPASTGRSGFGRRHPLRFRLAEVDPEANPTAIPDASVWQELSRQGAHDEDAPVLEPGLEDEDDYNVEPEESKKESRQDHRQLQWYLGNRITMARNPGPDSPVVFQIRELAEFYAAVWDTPVAEQNLAQCLNRASRFLMLDLLIHTGRPPGWIAAIGLGWSPSPDEIPRFPAYDARHGAICYAPSCHIGIPPRLLGIDDEAARERRQLAEACEPVQLWHYLPFTPLQVGLISAYSEVRAQALVTLPPVQGLQAADNNGPLLLVAQDGRLRPCSESDTEALCLDLTIALRHRHPGWPAIRPARFRPTFTAWYRHHGLDPVHGLCISAHYRNELQMPTIYSRIRVKTLACAYATAQQLLRAKIEAEYPKVTNSGRGGPLPWLAAASPELVAWRDDDSFGSWHCPLRSRLRALFAGLSDMAKSADSATAQRGRIGRIAVGLTVLTGLRPTEVCNLRARWVDLDDGTIATHGKDNFALTADRQVPIPRALQASLEQAVNESTNGPLPDDARGHYLLWLDQEGVPTALTEGESNRILVEAGLRAGLREEQVPDWSALRHFYRSYALEAGLPFEAINALIGHQALGCDLYNRALDQQVDAVLAHGQRLAHRIAQEVGWNDEAN